MCQKLISTTRPGELDKTHLKNPSGNETQRSAHGLGRKDACQEGVPHTDPPTTNAADDQDYLLC